MILCPTRSTLTASLFPYTTLFRFGNVYRPEQDYPTPTLGIVDGRIGKVLQTVPMPLSQNGKPPTLVGDIDARLDRQGKIFALFVLNGGRWFEWQQGKLPRETLLHPGRNG